MCAANLEGLTADAVAVTVGGWGGHLVRWKKLNITSLSSVATADRPERSGPAAPGEGAAFKKTKNKKQAAAAAAAAANIRPAFVRRLT